ncbi:MAG: DUF2300 domain-containing protein [Gammaproteobacteria bacterium]|nr:DUF2300 domain-containing protein [Gammaproteobacteria bacterium]
MAIEHSVTSIANAANAWRAAREKSAFYRLRDRARLHLARSHTAGWAVNAAGMPQVVSAAARCLIAVGGLTVIAAPADAHNFPARGFAYARLAPNAAASTQQFVDGRRTHATAQLRTPLGSVWKLFLYAYTVDRGIDTPDYVCTGDRALYKQEVYCCDSGMAVTRDAALSRSCGLYFSPQRLGIDASEWRDYWQQRAPEIAWLRDLSQLAPGLWVSVEELLRALTAIDTQTRRQAEGALMTTVLYGRAQDALPLLGGRFRVKTYTWQHPEHAEQVIGGAAGWLNDGSAIWLGARGSSVHVLKSHAGTLAALTVTTPARAPTAQCVDVNLFARYPIKKIDALHDAPLPNPTSNTALHGDYVVTFTHGQTLRLHSDGEVSADYTANSTLKLNARLSEAEYVARVIDREGNARHTQAARALGVVARSYLWQNATNHRECLFIEDSSRKQRVSPNPASAAARAAADFSDGLILKGTPAQYRQSTEAANILSWRHAVIQDNVGRNFVEILRLAFTDGVLAINGDAADCSPLKEAQHWLTARRHDWRRTLQTEPGYVEPDPRVCMLAYGNPYSDNTTQRIFVRGLFGLNNRLSLAHEYLHLAFAGFPSGHNEHYIEHWARRLVEGDNHL